MWCLLVFPLRGSVDKFCAGKTYCHSHDLGALGYFLARALGNHTFAWPSAKSFLKVPSTFSSCDFRLLTRLVGSKVERSRPPLPSRTKIMALAKSRS